MSRINWSKINTEKKISEYRLLGKKSRRQMNYLSAHFEELFEKALKRTGGSSQYGVVLTLQRAALTRNWFSKAQYELLTQFAGISTAPSEVQSRRDLDQDGRASAGDNQEGRQFRKVKCKKCGAVRNTYAERPLYDEGFCRLRCKELFLNQQEVT